MTKEQLEDFENIREENRILRETYKNNISIIEEQDKKNNRSCDHIFPDGRIAEGDNCVCLICGCGADFVRVKYLNNLNNKKL